MSDMKVKNWEQWTKFKKRYILFSLFMGCALSLGTDSWGGWSFIGLVFLFSGAFVIGTIHEYEW